VVAEGVETDIEANMAREAGVDMLQGYLIGRPHGELSEGRLPEGETAPVSSCAPTHTYAHISAMP
jgi:EAL domain-containing protein (putative c-di-GMP-specific phosphodiesterase class I)